MLLGTGFKRNLMPNDRDFVGVSIFGYAVRCAEKLCFSERSLKDFAASPPLFDVLQGSAA